MFCLRFRLLSVLYVCVLFGLIILVFDWFNIYPTQLNARDAHRMKHEEGKIIILISQLKLGYENHPT